jgi:hypothetical protein
MKNCLYFQGLTMNPNVPVITNEAAALDNGATETLRDRIAELEAELNTERHTYRRRLQEATDLVRASQGQVEQLAKAVQELKGLSAPPGAPPVPTEGVRLFLEGARQAGFEIRLVPPGKPEVDAGKLARLDELIRMVTSTRGRP